MLVRAQRRRCRDRAVESDGGRARAHSTTTVRCPHHPDGDGHGAAATRGTRTDPGGAQDRAAVRAVDGHARTAQEPRGRHARLRRTRSKSGVPDADELNLYLVGPPGWWSGDVRELIESKASPIACRRIDAQPVPVRAALYAEAVGVRVPVARGGLRPPGARGDGLRHTGRDVQPFVAARGRRLGRGAMRSERPRVDRQRDRRRCCATRTSPTTCGGSALGAPPSSPGTRTARETVALYREVLRRRKMTATAPMTCVSRVDATAIPARRSGAGVYVIELLRA